MAPRSELRKIRRRLVAWEMTKDCAAPAAYPTRITGTAVAMSKPAMQVDVATASSPVSRLMTTIDQVALAGDARKRPRRARRTARSGEQDIVQWSPRPFGLVKG